jgi:lysylphosphatidylglycerol synthetase-like protein (DUF2156 family)
MELLTTTAILAFGAEGAPFASMGLSPLAQLASGDSLGVDSSRLRALLGEAYETLDAPYDFRSLHRYKSKYAPDSWTPRYLCFTLGLGERMATTALRIALWRERRGARDQTASAEPQEVQ